MKRRGRPPHPDILTPREWEVLELLRGGLTNEQIAAHLGISLQGAKFHVSEILGKLQVPDRVAAARWQPPARRDLAPLLAPMLLLRRGVARWRASPVVLQVGSAFASIIVIGAVASGVFFLLRSGGRHVATAPGPVGAFTIGEGVEIPLLLEGDRLGLTSLTGATPDAITPPGNFAGVRFDASGRIVYAQLAGPNTGFYRVEDGRPRLVIAAPLDVGSAGAWSPDASQAAWLESGSLRISEPDASPRTVPVDGLAGLLWSPDSTQLMAWSADRAHVYVVDAATGAATATSVPVPQSWSSAGDVASLDQSIGDSRATLLLARSEGGDRRTLGSVNIPPEGGVPTPAFSPDGRWLAWFGADDANARSRLLVTDVRNGRELTPTCSACNPSSIGGSPAWSADGRFLLWAQDDHIVMAGTNDWMGTIVADGSLPSRSPDGSTIVYVRQAADLQSSTVYARRLGSGTETAVVQVTDNRPLDGQLAWSRDGSKLVVPLQTSESSRVYSFDPATGDVQTLPIDAPETAQAVLSPRGDAINDSGSSIVGRFDGTAVNIGGGVLTDWSRDGQRGLVVQGGLFEVRLSDGVRTQLLDGFIQDAVWSPDERSIAFVRDQRLGVLDLVTGQAKMLAPDLTAFYLPNSYGRGYVAWSPDGRRIAVGDWSVEEPTSQGRSDVYLVDPDRGEEARLTDSASGKLLYSFSPDGRRLAYYNERAQTVEVADVGTGEVTVSPGTDGADFVWTGDAQLIADTSQGVALLGAGGSTNLLVANTGGCRRFLIGWTGTRIIFSSRCSHRGL